MTIIPFYVYEYGMDVVCVDDDHAMKCLKEGAHYRVIALDEELKMLTIEPFSPQSEWDERDREIAMKTFDYKRFVPASMYTGKD
jgi:hypothetical protein